MIFRPFVPHACVCALANADLAPFAALNADPCVMEFFPGLLARAESDAVAARFRDHIAAPGSGTGRSKFPA